MIIIEWNSRLLSLMIFLQLATRCHYFSSIIIYMTNMQLHQPNQYSEPYRCELSILIRLFIGVGQKTLTTYIICKKVVRTMHING